MSDKIKVSQEGNTVGGHQAGRDVITNVTNLPQKMTFMQALIARYRLEVATNPEVRNIIEALQHYLSQADSSGQKVLGLEAKLSAAGRQNDMPRAARMKEMFAKKLERHFFSETAQHIYAFILSNIYQLFKVEIRPLLLAQTGQDLVNRAVYEKVLKPVFAELEDNVLLVNYDELEGMLYFLTGNCHLAWDGSC